MNLILESLNKFPLVEHQQSIGIALENATEEEFQQNEKFLGGTKQAKVERPKYPKKCVRERLRLLKPEAIHAVTAILRRELWGIKSLEKRKARESMIKSAAQGRILLPDADQATVDSLIEWIYRDTLSFIDPGHLCRIQALADKLGMVKLSSACTDRLSTATLAVLDQASSQGVDLKMLWDANVPTLIQNKEPRACTAPLSSACVVSVVFNLVFAAENQPTKLRNLVVDAIAGCGDAALLDRLLPNMNTGLRGHIMMAMMRNANAHTARTAIPDHAQHQDRPSLSRSVPIKAEQSQDEQQGTKRSWDATDNAPPNETALPK